MLISPSLVDASSRLPAGDLEDDKIDNYALNLKKMIGVKVDELEEKVISHFGFVPEKFLDHLPEGKYLIYVSSCLANKLVFMHPSPEHFLGYSLKEIIAGGIDLQVSRIHPEDLQGIYDKSLRMLKKSTALLEQGVEPTSFVLEYRLRRADGEWLEVQETKFYRYFEDGRSDRLLGKIVNISERRLRERSDAQRFVDDSKKQYPFLHSLRKQKKGTEKQPILSTAQVSTTVSEGINLLTTREKEVLQLIGSGLSTKQIAAQLFISINTVQTHRNHLLQKLQVKNSMELIREASKVFWL